MAKISIIGTGFVADLYMRSLETYPHIKILKVFDQNPARLSMFTKFWNLTPASSIEELLSPANPEDRPDLILNLTNPGAHYAVSKQCLEAGRNVYSEKPLATKMEDAFDLYDIATKRGLIITSAPCSYLSEVAQTLWLAIRQQQIGTPLLVYAELDDDFITQAPYKKWLSESGAPWPYEDEFKVGCTLEHAGYYLTWLMMIFGSVKKVVAASAELVKNKIPNTEITTPDFSTATLFFESGMVARITCGIVAPHNHSLRVIGDKGILEINESWNNIAKVKIRKRFVVRRKLVNSLFARRFKIKGKTHPKVPRRGAAAMNFALGPAEVLSAIAAGHSTTHLAEFALHLNEVTLAIQNALDSTGVQLMQTHCPTLKPMPWAK